MLLLCFVGLFLHLSETSVLLNQQQDCSPRGTCFGVDGCGLRQKLGGPGVKQAPLWLHCSVGSLRALCGLSYLTRASHRYTKDPLSEQDLICIYHYYCLVFLSDPCRFNFFELSIIYNMKNVCVHLLVFQAVGAGPPCGCCSVWLKLKLEQIQRS